jgi:hypothetical protein
MDQLRFEFFQIDATLRAMRPEFVGVILMAARFADVDFF